MRIIKCPTAYAWGYVPLNDTEELMEIEKEMEYMPPEYHLIKAMTQYYQNKAGKKC